MGSHEIAPRIREGDVLSTYAPHTMLDALYMCSPFLPNNYDRGIIIHILLFQAQSGDLSHITWLLEHKATTQINTELGDVLILKPVQAFGEIQCINLTIKWPTKSVGRRNI